MKLGTRSLLYGAHCFFIHPWFVLWGWLRLYGWPRDLATVAAIFLHDIGYWGCAEIDGPEGKQHPRLGAKIMHYLFDDCKHGGAFCPFNDRAWFDAGESLRNSPIKWYEFTLYHSRYMAVEDSKPLSRLCIADKLALCLTPGWLYLPMARATGELAEYMGTATDERKWLSDLKWRRTEWVEKHKDRTGDAWTSGRLAA
jgi:hypothetical protein